MAEERYSTEELIRNEIESSLQNLHDVMRDSDDTKTVSTVIHDLADSYSRIAAVQNESKQNENRMVEFALRKKELELKERELDQNDRRAAEEREANRSRERFDWAAKVWVPIAVVAVFIVDSICQRKFEEGGNILGHEGSERRGFLKGLIKPRIG